MEFRGYSEDERVDLLLTLENQAESVLRVLKVKKKLVQAFRCACSWGDSLSQGQLAFLEYEQFCRHTGIYFPSLKEQKESIKQQKETKIHLQEEVETYKDREGHTALDTEDASRIRTQLHRFELQEQLTSAQNTSKVVPCWQSLQDNEIEEPFEVGSTQRVISFGTGIRKRAANSAQAVLQSTYALSGIDPRITKSFMASLTMDDLGAAFYFLAPKQTEKLDFLQFVQVLILFARVRYHDKAIEDIHGAIHDLYMDYLLHYLNDVAPLDLRDLIDRAPIRRFPGMEDCIAHAKTIMERIFTVFSGGSSFVDIADVQRFLDGVQVAKIPHISEADVTHCMDTALTLATEYAQPSLEPTMSFLGFSPSLMSHGPEKSTGSTISFSVFVDILTVMAFEIYNVSSHREQLPTVPSRLHMFVYTWENWYGEQLGRSLKEDFRKRLQTAPKITSCTPMRVDLRQASTVVIEGTDFHSDGMYVRFGHLVSLSSAVSRYDGSIIVNVPPMEPTSTVIHLLHDSEDNADGEEQLSVAVNQFRRVPLSISSDGNNFYRNKGFTTSSSSATSDAQEQDNGEDEEDLFLYEHQFPMISLKNYAAKFRMIFSSYSSLVDKEHEPQMKAEQWRMFKKQFKIVEPKHPDYVEMEEGGPKGEVEGGNEGSIVRSKSSTMLSMSAPPPVQREMSTSLLVPATIDGGSSLKRVPSRSFNPEQGIDESISSPIYSRNQLELFENEKKELSSFYNFAQKLHRGGGLSGAAYLSTPPTLGFESFIKAVIYCFVLDDAPVEQALKSMFDNDAWIGREGLVDVPTAHRGEFSLRIRRAANSFNLVRMVETVEHTNSPRGGNQPIVDKVLKPNPMDNVPGRWTNEVQHERLLLDFVTKSDQDTDSLTLQKFKEMIRSAADKNVVVSSPPKRKLSGTQLDPELLKMSMVASKEGGGPSTTFQAPINRNNEEYANFTPEEIKDPAQLIKRYTNHILLHCQREDHARVARREADIKANYRRQVARLEQDLLKEKEKNDKTSAELQKFAHVKDVNTVGDMGRGVLQAEKEELQRVFIYELEKRRNKLVEQTAMEESFRDSERERVVSQLRDQMMRADHMFRRMQETVKGQATTIEQQCQVLSTLKNRSHLLKVDGHFFRESHDRLVGVVDKAKHRDLLEKVETARIEHEELMAEIAIQMDEDAAKDGKRPVATTDDLIQAQKMKKMSKKDSLRKDKDADKVNELSQVRSEFTLPDVPNVIVTYTDAEVDDRITEAIGNLESAKKEAVKEKDEEIECLQKTHEEEMEQLKIQLMDMEARHQYLEQELENSENMLEDLQLQAQGQQQQPGEVQHTSDGIQIQIPSEEQAKPESPQRTPLTLSLQAAESPSRTPISSALTPRSVTPRSLTPRIVFQAPPPKETSETEVQTDTPRIKKAPQAPSVVDEYAKYFGNSLDIVMHYIQPTDTFQSICEMYEVQRDDILKANFMAPPSSSSNNLKKIMMSESSFASRRTSVALSERISEPITPAFEEEAPLGGCTVMDNQVVTGEKDKEGQEEELNLVLHGIPSKTLRIPVPLGGKEHYEMLASLKGAVQPADGVGQAWSPMEGNEGDQAAQEVGHEGGEESKLTMAEMLGEAVEEGGKKAGSEEDHHSSISASTEGQVKVQYADENDAAAMKDGQVEGEENREAQLNSEIKSLRGELFKARYATQTQLTVASQRAHSLREGLDELKKSVQLMPTKIIESYEPQIMTAVREAAQVLALTTRTSPKLPMGETKLSHTFQNQLQHSPRKPTTAMQVNKSGGGKKGDGVTPTSPDNMSGIPILTIGEEQEEEDQLALLLSSQEDGHKLSTPLSPLTNEATMGGLYISNEAASEVVLSITAPAFRAGEKIRRRLTESSAGVHKTELMSRESMQNPVITKALTPIPTVSAIPTAADLEGRNLQYLLISPAQTHALYPPPGWRKSGEEKIVDVEGDRPEDQHEEKQRAVNNSPSIPSSVPRRRQVASNTSQATMTTPQQKLAARSTHPIDLNQNGFLLNQIAHDIVDHEYIRRLQIVKEAETVFARFLIQHEHKVEVWFRKHHEVQVKQLQESRKIEKVVLKGVEKAKVHLQLSKRQEGDRNAQVAAQRRREDGEKRKQLVHEEKLSQLEYRAVLAVKLKRMLNEQAQSKKAPIKIKYLPKLTNSQQQYNQRMVDLAKTPNDLPWANKEFIKSKAFLKPLQQTQHHLKVRHGEREMVSNNYYCSDDFANDQHGGNITPSLRSVSAPLTKDGDMVPPLQRLEMSTPDPSMPKNLQSQIMNVATVDTILTQKRKPLHLGSVEESLKRRKAVREMSLTSPSKAQSHEESR